MPSIQRPDDAEATKGSAAPESSDESAPEPRGDKGSSGTDRRGIAVGAVLLAACAGLVAYGMLDTTEEPTPRTPTAAVTYEIEGKGTADITYQARSESGDAVVAHDITLPWKKTVNVPLGKAPLVTITLGEQGGRASCQLAVRGRHVQTATAFGRFGRATCQGELPSPEPSDASTVGEKSN